MGEQKDPLVSVHDVLGFLPDFHSLSDPPCCPIRFPDDNCRLLPVDDVIFSERDYVTFAICDRNSVCRLSVCCLSVVCDVGAPYSGG